MTAVPKSDPTTLPLTQAHSWISVDLGQLEHNLASLKARLRRGVRLCVVMKADAYGLGIAGIAPVLIRHWVDFIAVASNAEAVTLRQAGYGGRLMRIRTASPDEALAAASLGVEEMIGDVDTAQRLSALALATDRAIPVHFALNAGGIGRDGLELSAPGGQDRAQVMLALPGLRIVGIMTHFPDTEADALRGSLAIFRAEADWLIAQAGLDRSAVLIHAASSIGTLALPEAHLDMVRCGAVLFGCIGDAPEFAPVLSLCARISSITELPAGASVGYDRTMLLNRPTRLANISLGYADGYPRSFSNCGDVLIGGMRAPVLGKVSMNSIMADVTDVAAAAPGAVAVMFGPQGAAQITRTEVQEISGRVMADLCCSWGALNDRLYLHALPISSEPDHGL